MPNHGYCKNCWWWKPIPTIMPMVVESVGRCYMQSCGGHQEYTPETSYCPDYLNRKKGNKKQTLDEWLISIDYENNI